MPSEETVLVVLAAASVLAAAIVMTRYVGPTRLRIATPCHSGHVQLVVARYAEDLSWLARLPYPDILVYDKNDRGDTTHGNPPPWAKVVRLPNVGRCDHTYLHHIVRNWDRLADVTVFLPGSCLTSSSKRDKLSWVLDRVARAPDSAFPTNSWPWQWPIYNRLRSFKLDSYKATDGANAAINPESRLLPSVHRPFRAFYEAHFPELPPEDRVVYQGVFAVSRKHIRQHPRTRYQRLLATVDGHSNPEAGHFMERAWVAAFYPIPERCTSSQW